MGWIKSHWSSPEFVILGIEVEDGVLLVASDTLNEAEVKQEVEEEWLVSYSGNRRYIPRYSWCELYTHMNNLVIIKATTYTEAFRNLFEQWTPKPSTRKALGEGTKALPQ